MDNICSSISWIVQIIKSNGHIATNTAILTITIIWIVIRIGYYKAYSSVHIINTLITKPTLLLDCFALTIQFLMIIITILINISMQNISCRI